MPVRSTALEAYLLGSVGFDELQALQRRLVYDVTGERRRGILILAEVPPLITIGRDGSRAHVLYEPDELWTRGWPIRWVNRGGGALLHVPGQLQITGVFALDRMNLNLPSYLSILHSILANVAIACDAKPQVRHDRPGVWVKDRLLAHVGVAVHDWVVYYGAALNIDPDLSLFRGVACDGNTEPMTSLARERRGPVRVSLVRQRLVESFADRLGFERTAIFHRHPLLRPIPVRQDYAYRTA
jgi:lipoyl(octanoyl) transferase